MLISKVKPSEAYTLFGKTRKKLFKVGLVIKATTSSWDSKTNLFLWGGKKSYMNRLSYSMWGEPAGALSAGACWPGTVPCCRWALVNQELWENQRLQALPMDAAQERMGRRGRRAGLLPSPFSCHRTAAFLSHPEVSPSGGSKGKRNRREFHAPPHVVDKGSCYTHTASSYLIFLRVFSGRTPQLLPHIYI